MTVDDEAGGAARPSRERELTSLYATARSLTALGELDDVLDSIVRHAHELVGTDFTYLSLLGDDGHLRLTASEGTISAAFRDAHIPPGTGLGGKVIASRAAHWVSNYPEATDLEHDAGFDSLIGKEGLAALLGVPLLVRDEAIGALFVADRAEREFRTDEIALLSAFADHAAVALDNARLYDESRSALTRLQSAYRTIEEQMAVMERAQSLHEALTRVVLTGGGPEDVALQLAEQMGGVVTILDRGGALVASGSVDEAAGEVDIHDHALTEAVGQGRDTGRAATATDHGGRRHTAATIHAGDSQLGTLIWSQDREPGAADVRSLERATHIIGLLMLKENAAADAAERLTGELLTELLVAGPEVSSTQRARARSRGIDVDALSMVVTAESGDVPHSELARRLRRIAGPAAGLAGEHLGRATMLIPAAEPDQCVREVHRQLRAELGQPATVVGELVSGHDWARSLSRASRCLSVARAVGADDVGTTTEQLSLYAIVFDVERHGELDSFLADAIGSLLDYDRLRSTELVATLGAYFDHGGNLRQTARALHVHLNTLHKRLDRVGTVLGRDWRAVDDLQLRLAIRLETLRRRLGASA